MVRAMSNYCLADRINSYVSTFAAGPFCSLESKGEAVPLSCSVNKSASLGDPWRVDNPSLRRGVIRGDYCDLKTRKLQRGFNPKRSAFEMHSSYLAEMKQSRPWYKDVNADVLQQALKHQDAAFQKFFNGEAGFPNFRRTVDIEGLEFKPGTVKYNEAEKKAFIPTIGWVSYFKSRDLGDGYKVKTSWLKYEADGIYLVSLIDYPDIPDCPKKDKSELKTAVGIDRGVKKVTASSDGSIIENPRIQKKYERRLAIRQRRVSRKKKGSKNRAKAGKQVAKLHQKIKRQRDDFQWKAAKAVASSADVIGLEDLNIKGMMKRCRPKKNEETGKHERNGQAAKAGLNKALADVALYSLELKIRHQAAKLGNWVVSVLARNTSLECSECGYTSKANRPEQEKFICQSCGHHEDADIDAGVVIANRTVQKLGIDTLRVVSPKVTPSPAVAGGPRMQLSLALAGEAGNQSVSKEMEKPVQLQLFRWDALTECGARFPQESPVIANGA